MQKHYTEHKYDKEALDALMDGAFEVYRPVSTTQGPRGRNIAINKGFDFEVLHDGLKVSRFIQPKDKFKALGANILREAAEKQGTEVGDGTTLTIVLAYQIAKGAKVLIEAGKNPMQLARGLEKGRDLLIEEVKKLSKPIIGEKEKIEIATISSEDPKLGQMIGSTYHKIGVDGVIIADESKSFDTELEHQEGINIDHGFLSWKFITDPKTLTATVRDANIMFLDKELSDIYDVLPFIEEQLKPTDKRNFVIIARNVTGTALSSLAETKVAGLMNIICIKAPSFGKYQREMLEDMATMCGGKVIDEDKQIKDATFEDLGFAESVKATRDSATILGNKGSVKSIKTRISALRTLLKDPESDLDLEKLKERISRMTGGVYVIKVGGATEPEMAERVERVDDAIKATRAAIQGGIVPGGEVALLSVRNVLKASNQNEQFAFKILDNAMEKPFDKLLENAGLDAGYYRAKLEDKPFGWGVDVVDLKLKDMVSSGIIDPTLVITEAIRSAVSVAILLITNGGLSALNVEGEGDKNE